MTQSEALQNLDKLLNWLQSNISYSSSREIKKATFPDMEAALFNAMLDKLVNDGYVKYVSETQVLPNSVPFAAQYKITFEGLVFEGYEKTFNRENSEALSSAKTEKLLTDLQIILAVGAVAVFVWQIWEWVWDNFCFC